MRRLLALILLVVAAGCGKSNSNDPNSNANVASAGISTDCLFNSGLCNNQVYNDYYQSGFIAYPGGAAQCVNGSGYYPPGYQNGMSQTGTPYYGPQFGYQAGFQYNYQIGSQVGYGGYPQQQYYPNGGIPQQQYYNGYQQNVCGAGYNGGANGLNLCSCPVGYRPVYNGAYGLGCVRSYYMYQYSNMSNIYYYNGSATNNNQWTNWPQYSTPYGTTANGCYQDVAWSCMVDAPSTCPGGTRCQLIGNSNRMGICVRQ